MIFNFVIIINKMEIANYCLSNIIMELSEYCSRYSMPWRSVHNKLFVPFYFLAYSFLSTGILLYRMQTMTMFLYLFEKQCLNIWFINIIFIMVTISLLINSMENDNDNMLIYLLLSTLEFISFVYTYFNTIESRIIKLCSVNIIIYIADILVLLYYDQIYFSFP